MSSIQLIAATLVTVAAPGMARKDLIAAVRQKYPDASKKEIVRAAFYALTENTNSGREKLSELHDFAFAERASAEEDTVAQERPRKKLKRKSRDQRQAPLPETPKHPL